MTAALALLFAIACAPSFRGGRAPDEYPRRLVLALDGVDYRDVLSARERGLFVSFRKPSRLASTFPSISDIAWHEIFGILPPRGYQRVYYSRAYNMVMGGPIDAITPIEFENRMDFAFGGKFHHLSAYIASATVARDEIEDTFDQLMKVRGRRTVYAYNVGPDALQHTRGDIASYLQHLDTRLVQLQQKYRNETGRELEVVLLSDHGHNRSSDARFLPLIESLAAHGFTSSRQLRTSRDVAYSVDGVTTGFGIFVLPESVDTLASLLSSMEGVDVVTTAKPTGIIVRRGDMQAQIQTRAVKGVHHHRYVVERGDPLEVLPIIALMKRSGAIDTDGFAASAAWEKHSFASAYPAAIPRIVRGHTTVTLNPAPILVSLKHGWRVGLGLVSVANRLRPLGGTHGALDSSNALGVVMTNFKDTHDDVTSGVRAQLGGFDDMNDHIDHAGGARLSSAAMIARDRFNALRSLIDSVQPSTQPALEVWIGDAQRSWNIDRLALTVAVTRYDANLNTESIVGSTRTAASDWSHSADGVRYFAPLSRLKLPRLEPHAAYTIRVTLAEMSADPRRQNPVRRVELAAVPVRTGDHGSIHPF